MLPLSLELSRLRLALIGNGAAALRRLRSLEAAGAASLRVFAPAPTPELARAAGTRLERRLPKSSDLIGCHLVLIADLIATDRDHLAEAARGAGALVHVEDAPLLSDTQMPAVLRRGDLSLAIATNGAAPALAAEMKAFLGEIIGPEWRRRVAEAGRLRRRWRAAGASHGAIRRLTAAHMAQRGWLHDRNIAIDERATTNSKRR